MIHLSYRPSDRGWIYLRLTNFKWIWSRDFKIQSRFILEWDFSILVQCSNRQRWWRRRRSCGGGGSSSSIIIELQAMMTMGLTHIALHCRDQLGQSKQSRASQQGQMFCSPCQIWSQDTPFISFVTLVSKNFAAYLRFLKWKPFLAFHFPSHNGVWNAQAALLWCSRDY